MGDRCTGHCCHKFALPFSPNEMVEHLAFERALEAHKADPQNIPAPNCYYPDGTQRQLYHQLEQVAGMVEHLGHLLPWPDEPEGGRNTAKHFYRCKNLQDDGNCGIYDTRPDMCRGFPYGRVCSFKECTWDAARSPQQDNQDASLSPA